MWARPRLALVCALASSCAVGPNFQRPRPPSVGRYTHKALPSATAIAAAQAQRFDDGGHLQAEWWHLLRCRALDVIIAEAMRHNPNLAASEARLRNTQDALRAGYGVFSPQLDGNLGVTRQQFTPSRFGVNQPPTVFNLFTIGATVSYALDLWGGQRRSVEALRAQVEAQRYTVIGAAIMLQGNLVNAVVAAASYDEQLRATRELIELEDVQVQLGHVQWKAGIVPYANVVSLESQLASTRASLPPLEQRRDQSWHLVAALVGSTPGEWAPPSIKLDDLSLPEVIPVSLPSQLVRQRPDILVAEARLHAATAQIGVATAALLPNITLSGSVGASNTALSSLFTPAGLFWSIAAALAQPIFHGGTLWYQRKQAIDARDEAVANYHATVIGAFQQVADSLRGIEHDASTLAAQETAVAAADTARRLLQTNYEAGVATYLQLLIANAQLRQAKIGYIQARAQRIQDTVSLFVALGGGWWNDPATAAPGSDPKARRSARSDARRR